MKFPEIRNLSPVIRCLLGILFIYAGIIKIPDPQGFLAAIYGYDFPLPEMGLKIAALWLPWLEVITGILLLGRIWLPATTALLVMQMVVFLLVTIQAVIRGIDINDCGCFGAVAEKLPAWFSAPPVLLFRETVMLVLALWLCWQIWSQALKDEAFLHTTESCDA